MEPTSVATTHVPTDSGSLTNQIKRLLMDNLRAEQIINETHALLEAMEQRNREITRYERKVLISKGILYGWLVCALLISYPMYRMYSQFNEVLAKYAAQKQVSTDLYEITEYLPKDAKLGKQYEETWAWWVPDGPVYDVLVYTHGLDTYRVLIEKVKK